MDIVFFLILILFACIFHGITGFGVALIASPLALLFLDKITAVVSLTVVGLILNAFLFKKIKQPINWNLLIPLFIGSLIGLPLGIIILKIIPTQTLKIFIGSLVIVSTLILQLKKTNIPKNKYITAIAGFLSGTLETSTRLGGPPIVLLLTSHNTHKEEFRKTIVTFFLTMNIVAVPLFLLSNIVNYERLKYGIYAIPFVILGAYIGHKIVKIIPQEIFQKIAVIAVLATGIISIYSALK